MENGKTAASRAQLAQIGIIHNNVVINQMLYMLSQIDIRLVDAILDEQKDHKEDKSVALLQVVRDFHKGVSNITPFEQDVEPEPEESNVIIPARFPI